MTDCWAILQLSLRVVRVEEALSRPAQVMSIGQPSKFSEQENQLNIYTLDMKSLWLKLKISRSSGHECHHRNRGACDIDLLTSRA